MNDMSTFDWNAFILADLEADAPLPHTIAEGCQFRRASQEEVDQDIEPSLERFRGSDVTKIPAYGLDCKDAVKANVLYSQTPLLTVSTWKYYVITYQGSEATNNSLEHALAIARPDMQIGFMFNRRGNVLRMAYHSQRILAYFDSLIQVDRISMGERPITRDDFALVGRYYEQIQKLVDPKYSHIVRGFERLMELKSLPYWSSVMVLGLFSVIECVLTHDPGPSTPETSLTHQISTKIPLVSGQFDYSPRCPPAYKEVSAKKLWSRLYDLRSKIIHGDHVDYNKEQQLLQSPPVVVEYLHDTVKLLLIECIKNPEFMTNLKAC